MTVREYDCITLADAAAYLRAQVGDFRAWGFYLIDRIRGRQKQIGDDLLPFARIHQRGGLRPVYLFDEVRRFAKQAKEAYAVAKPTPIQPIKLKVDLTEKPFPCMRKFDSDLNPI